MSERQSRSFVWLLSLLALAFFNSVQANGNVTFTGGKTFGYDSQNELVSMTTTGKSVGIVYDGDGNRIAKMVNGITTLYLVDDLNPTGYPQVVEESNSAGVMSRTYTYGLQRISEYQFVNGAWTPSFYGYDGGGSVRQLTNAAGTVTDSYEYDAFGNALVTTGNTPNNYLYRGEQYDTDLGLYYLRARYYNPLTGRFMSRDPENGTLSDPASLHRYLYAGGDPINAFDPTGRAELFQSAIITGGSAMTSTEIAIAAVAGAVSDAAAWAFSQYLRAAAFAASRWAALAAWAEAMLVLETAKGLTRVFFCGAAGVTLGLVLDHFGLSGTPSSIKTRFAQDCVEFLNGLPFP